MRVRMTKRPFLFTAVAAWVLFSYGLIAQEVAPRATLYVTNDSRETVVVEGRELRPGASARISVPANSAGSVKVSSSAGGAAEQASGYPELNPGAMYSMRIGAAKGGSASGNASAGQALVCPIPEAPSAPGQPLSLPTYVGDAYDKVDDLVSVPKHIYDLMAPFIGDGPTARAEIMKRVDARWPDKIWVPRDLSTMLGSVERVMGAWEKMGMAKKAAEVGTMVFMGLKEGKSPSEISDLLLKTKTLLPDDFGAGGELAFYSGEIIAGLVSGKTFSEAASDLIDFDSDERMGFWGKVGAGWGFLVADAVIGIEKFLTRDERARLEQGMIESLRKGGYNEDAVKALREWMAMDDALKGRIPFKLKDEWKVKSEEDPKEDSVDEKDAEEEEDEGKKEPEPPPPSGGGSDAIAFVEGFFKAVRSAALAAENDEQRKAVDALDRFFIADGFEHDTEADRDRYENDRERWGNARANSEATGLLLLGIAFVEGKNKVECSMGGADWRQACEANCPKSLTAAQRALPFEVVVAKISIVGAGDEDASWGMVKLVKEGGKWKIQMLRISEKPDPGQIDWNPND